MASSTPVQKRQSQSPRRRIQSATDWFDEARLGMFVHWGLYSILGRGEWVMHQEKIPAAEYNKLAQRFTAENFDADALVQHAVDCGAKYAVLTSRHHDGFCLWDTKTTDFNSVKSAAKRDLIAEYVKACRRAGLRVGIYYSIMSWQHDALHKGPYADPAGWEAMVCETHKQLRELMSRYGRIDMLWYDGGFVPGLGDAQSIAKYWRSKQLNSMIRELQPGILINDRSGLAEDFTTPEQHIVPAPRGRRWEACITLNNHWGYHKDDDKYKPVPFLIDLITTCARFGGNLLLNIGPRGDGSVTKGTSDCLKGLGQWMRTNGDSIYGSQRTDFSEADLGNHLATTRDDRIFLHVSPESIQPIRVGIGGNCVRGAKVLGGGNVRKTNLSDQSCMIDVPSTAAVVELRCEKAASKTTPAIRLDGGETLAADAAGGIVFGTGKYDPEPAPVLTADEIAKLGIPSSIAMQSSETWAADWVGDSVLTANATKLSLKVPVPCPGKYSLQLGIVGTKPAKLSVSIGEGKRFLKHISHMEMPECSTLDNLVLTSKATDILLTASTGSIGLYAYRLQPIWRPIDSTLWQTVGPFETRFGAHRPTSDVREALEQKMPPQQPGRLKAVDAMGRKVTWETISRRQGEHSAEGVNFPYRVARDYVGVCFARTTIISPVARDSEIRLGCDWWANAWINQELITSDRSDAEVQSDGAQFNAWKPRSAKIRLKRGKNELLIKCHPGTAACWFTCWISDPGDLKIAAEKF